VRLSQFVGNPRAVEGLRQDVASGRPAHSYLLVGADHVGKLTLGIALAQALNCLNPTDGEACGVCAECTRIAEGNHPDVRVTQARSGEGEEDIVLEGATVTIEQAHELRKRAGLKPYQGRYKVEVLAGADRLTVEAANALLKTLEEPPSDTVLILTATNLEGVLATIQSRCRQVRLAPMDSEALAQVCEQRFPTLGATELKAIVSWAGGKPGLAFALGERPEALAKRDALLGLFAEAVEAPPLAAFRLAEELQRLAQEWWQASTGQKKVAASKSKVTRTAVADSLELLLGWLHELLRVQLGEDASGFRFADRYTLLESLSQTRDAAWVLAALESVQRARRAALSNANLQLALEALFLKLALGENFRALSAV